MSRGFRLLAVLIPALLAGCATITRGTKEVLIIESKPLGADVDISPVGVQCKTPCSIELKRKQSQTVTIRKEGFEPVTVKVIPQVVGAGSAGMAGNVLVGGLIGAAIDGSSGAMKDLKPNPIKVDLTPLQPTQSAATPAASAPDPNVVEVSNSSSDPLPGK